MPSCGTVVPGRDGEGSAVLLRAAEPLEGADAMAERRGTLDARLLCSGPARICQAFGVDREVDGADLVEGDEFWIERGGRGGDAFVAAGPRGGGRGGGGPAMALRGGRRPIRVEDQSDSGLTATVIVTTLVCCRSTPAPGL